jgi:integrase
VHRGFATVPAPKYPKPWYRPARRTWYVQIDGKQHNLGPDRDGAFERYHELMRDRPRAVDPSLALGIIDAFLDWVEQNQAPRTYEWYRRHCEAFARSIPPLLPVGRLKPHHLTGLLAAHPEWSSSTRHGLCRAVQRAFKWAEDEELIVRSPLRKVNRPRMKRREVVLSDEEFARLLADASGEAFRDVLVTAWETGCRPQEIVAVEARHVDLVNARWIFPVDESKGERSPRIVYLNARALEITRRLALRHPSGPLFRNEEGRPWNRHALGCAFARLQIADGLRRMKELGVDAPAVPRFRRREFADPERLAAARGEQERRLYERRKELHRLARKHGERHSLYHLRHSWATRALKRGVDPLTVAILMGHADPTMLAKVYQHLAHDPDFLRRAAMRATGDVGRVGGDGAKSDRVGDG